MTLKEFIQSMTYEVKKLLPIDASIRHHLIEKNNGINMDAILIKLPEYNIAPTIYINDYYKDYIDGMEISVLAKDLVRQFYLSLPSSNYDLSAFTNYEKIKSNIRYMVIQYSANIDRLDEIAHIRYLDLAIIFICDITLDTCDGSITITNNHLKLWDITLDELKKQAFENTPLSNPAEITPLVDILKNMPRNRIPESFDYSLLDIDCPIYVLTNKSGHAGAACILYPDLLDNFCSLLADDIYIIPSSIHEVMLLPLSEFENYPSSCFRDVISTVNNNYLSCTEILSNNLYIYTRATHEISIAV